MASDPGTRGRRAARTNGYCGSTSTLKLTSRPRRSPATACTAASISATAARRSVALTTTWLRSRPRRRKSGAGPSAAPAAPPASRARTAAAAACAPPPPAGAEQTIRTSVENGGERSARGHSSSPATDVCASWRGGRRGGGGGRRGARGGRLAAPPPARGAPAGAAGELRDEREGPLLGAEVGEAQRRVGVEHDAERHVGEVVALGDHLGPDEHPALRLLERSEHRGGPGRVRVEAEHGMAGLRELVLEPLGAGAVPADGHRPAGVAAPGDGLAVPAVMAGEQRLAAVQHERDVAVRVHPHLAAG